MQRLGKHSPAAMDTRATEEVMLETVFSTRSVQTGYKEDNWCNDDCSILEAVKTGGSWKEAAVQRGVQLRNQRTSDCYKQLPDNYKWRHPVENHTHTTWKYITTLGTCFSNSCNKIAAHNADSFSRLASRKTVLGYDYTCLYAGGIQFESRPGHRLSWLRFSWFLSPSKQCCDITRKYAKTFSFQIISNYSLSNTNANRPTKWAMNETKWKVISSAVRWHSTDVSEEHFLSIFHVEE
jgi:hypothetical protein